MHTGATNGARPVPVGPKILGVPQDLRDLIAELADTEVPMNETAAEKLMAAIGKNHETVLAKIDGIKEQYYTLDKQITVFEAVKSSVNELDVRLDAVDDRLKNIDTRLTATTADVGTLMKVHEGKVGDQRQDKRRVRDKVIDGAIYVFLVAIGAAGIQYVRSVNAPPPPQTQQDSQGAVTTKINELIEEMRTDRAARETQPAQTVKVPPRNKPRQAPAPPLGPSGPGASYKSGDVLANPILRAYSSPRIKSIDGRF